MTLTPNAERLAVKLSLPVFTAWVCRGRDSHNQPSTCEANAQAHCAIVAVAIVGRTLVTSTDVVPCVIRDGTYLAHFTSLSSVNRVQGENLVRTEKLSAQFEDLIGNDLAEQQSGVVQTLLISYSHLFAKSNSDLGSTNVVEREINVGNARTIKEPLRRLPFHATEIVDNHVEEMLRDGKIEPSSSPWGAGICACAQEGWRLNTFLY